MVQSLILIFKVSWPMGYGRPYSEIQESCKTLFFFFHLPGDPKRQIEKIEEDDRDRFR